MLAQNLKTPEQLALTAEQFKATINLLGLFERGEIKPSQFNMRDWCGTACCIWGHLHLIDPIAFRSPGEVSTHPMNALFLPTEATLLSEIKMDQAAIAIRNYLTHGEPRWDEALGT